VRISRAGKFHRKVLIRPNPIGPPSAFALAAALSDRDGFGARCRCQPTPLPPRPA